MYLLHRPTGKRAYLARMAAGDGGEWSGVGDIADFFTTLGDAGKYSGDFVIAYESDYALVDVKNPPEIPREMVGADIGLSLLDAMLLDPTLMASWHAVRREADRRAEPPVDLQASLVKWIEANF
jgi:hypothetical protein